MVAKENLIHFAPSGAFRSGEAISGLLYPPAGRTLLCSLRALAGKVFCITRMSLFELETSHNLNVFWRDAKRNSEEICIKEMSRRDKTYGSLK
jgi:hypothetical protein